MKTMFIKIILICSLLGSTSCSTIKGVFGKSSTQEAKQAQKIELVEKAQSKNVQSKMDEVAVLASGTDYALTKVTNKEPAVGVAYDINKRVESLAGKPDLDAEKEMWKTVDELTSQIGKERDRGIKSLEKKDKEITILQDESKALAAAKEEEISKYKKMYQDAALLSDTYKSNLDRMNSWLGLGAIWYGVKHFITSSMWILGIGGAVFLILRLLASSNPVAGAIFGIFEQVVSWVINTIKVIFPKALSIAGNVSKQAYDEIHGLLSKIVDSIQWIKDTEKATGKPVTLKDLLNELDKTMDSNQKQMVSDIKKKLGY